MIEKDFILREVQQLANVLAQVLFRRQLEQKEQVQEVLAEGLEDVLGMSLDTLRGLPRRELVALFAPGGVLSGEKAVAVADLLREDASVEGRMRARWLYERVLQAGQAVPFDVHERIAALPNSDSREDGDVNKTGTS